MTDINQILQQAQKMQEQMKKNQEELASKEVTGESGAGLVRIVMNGRYEVKDVFIDSSLVSEDKEILEDLIAAAINAATIKVADNTKDQFAGMTAGLNLPEGFKFPF